MQTPQIGILLLAAGAGSRMKGSVKQLLPYRTLTLIQHSINVYQSLAVDARLVVLGAHQEEISKQTHWHDFQVAVNADWSQGMGHSLSYGLELLLQGNHLDYVLIALADQPLIERPHLEALIALAKNNPDKIIQSAFSDETGPPCLFPAHYFPELLQLNGAHGAKGIAAKYPEACLTLALPEAGTDIDTPADYEALLRLQSGS
ncbi:MobA-like molybdenum cofactor biosynthesis protein [Nitritalea halalkaliphila LW7]|uniref:MobA-like molybdenum cofactor biosynthesis protein n=1 Tax=Nitritalea halalkaliphila LW7 TaxID=1189621 RepID=I5C3V0_9BACT|nr:nucleotidyltransferase family protein [Nitritalea halalkaliphila]EIM76502.1 MobA-like molybdenum cofactor biosynthesis protein [Nitritalea halalkaliphila LW7]